MNARFMHGATNPADPYWSMVQPPDGGGLQGLQRLHIGCGFKRLDGFINVDAMPACMPDQVADIEQPWPWADDSVSEIVAEHVLEHVGQTPAQFIAVLKEMYRVCRDGAVIRIVVPHPDHEVFAIDPTHVRAIRPQTLAMFDQTRNAEVIATGNSETPLGLYHDLDLELLYVNMVPDAAIGAALQAGQISEAELQQLERHQRNIIIETRMVLRVHKPGRGKTCPPTFK